MTEPKFVYFIRPVGMDAPTKIGCTYDPTNRLTQLTRWSPFPLEIIALVNTGSHFNTVERQLHTLLRDHHSHCEWFHKCDLIDRIVHGVQSGLPLNEIVDLPEKTRSLHPRRKSVRRAA